mgnify:CR=1 FL=1
MATLNINVDAKMAEIDETEDCSLTIESNLGKSKPKLDSNTISKPNTNNNSVDKI